MTELREKRSIPWPKVVRMVSLILIGLSILPCLCAFVNVGPTIDYSIEQGKNYALNLYLPLCAATILNGLGIVGLIICLFVWKDEQ